MLLAHSFAIVEIGNLDAPLSVLVSATGAISLNELLSLKIGCLTIFSLTLCAR